MARFYRHRVFLLLGALSSGCSSQTSPSQAGAGGAGGDTTASSSSGGSGGSATGPAGQATGSSSGGISSGAGSTPSASSSSSSSGATGSSSSGSGGAGSSSSGGGGSSGGATDAGAGATDSGGAVSSDGDGATVSGTGDGDYMVGPTYTTSPDLMSKGLPAGKTFNFVMSSTSSKIFTGMAPTLLAANQHSFMRSVQVYVPAKYKDGTVAPFMVIQDGPGQIANIKNALDNLTQGTDPTRRLPAFIAIAVQNGGGDGMGSERGFEYDTVSGAYAEFVQTEVLPAVMADATIKGAYPNLMLATDPDGRGTVGCSSGAAAAFTMGWFHPEWFHRIITYSGTFVAQQNPTQPESAMYPLGAWDYHSVLNLVGMTTPAKPLRVFINANQMDNGAGTGDANHHDWLLANQRMAAAFKAQGYHYRFVEGLGASHCARQVQDLTMADTLLWVWQGYPLNY
jgi:enterochelin esterase family protein